MLMHVAACISVACACPADLQYRTRHRLLVLTFCVPLTGQHLRQCHRGGDFSGHSVCLGRCHCAQWCSHRCFSHPQGGRWHQGYAEIFNFNVSALFTSVTLCALCVALCALLVHIAVSVHLQIP